MIDPNNDQTTDKATGDATSAFCADFLGDFDTPTDIAEAGVGQDGLPSGSPVLVVKRGSGWISRSHPPGDIPIAASSSTTSASADGTPSFEGITANAWWWTLPASTEPMSIANRSSRWR